MIKINNLHKYYGEGENRTEVLKGINLKIDTGKLVCILGPSGSGKSTLLNIIGGIEVIDEGNVEVDSYKLDKMNSKELEIYRRKNLGFVFQFYNLVNNLTVKENIEVGEYLSDNSLNIMEIIENLGLKEHIDKYPHQISGGQAQRTSIGRAMVKNPLLLICDEPTGALDYESAKEVLKLIEKLKKEHTTTILVATHNTQIAKMCDMVLRLHDGNILEIKENHIIIPANEVTW